MKYIKKVNKYYVLGIILSFITVISFSFLLNSQKGYEGNTLKQTGYVYSVLSKLTMPVEKEVEIKKYIKPYKDDTIKIVKEYYDYSKNEEEQENAIIYFEDTYMQSTGIAYSNGDKFNVIAVFDGDVLEVVNDEFIGNSITIEHDGIKAIYQSLSEIDVSVGDYVKQGAIIGVSGTSNINSNLGNHLFFELVIDNEYVNPEEYYDLNLE